MLEYTAAGVRGILPVFDACQLSGQAPLANPAGAVAIIVRSGAQHIGLLVDRLIDVIACDSIALPPGGINPKAPWINGYIHDSRADTAPVFTLDPDGLQALTEPALQD
jgi:chemotaxis signal transduction protein